MISKIFINFNHLSEKKNLLKRFVSSVFQFRTTLYTTQSITFEASQTRSFMIKTVTDISLYKLHLYTILCRSDYILSRLLC